MNLSEVVMHKVQRHGCSVHFGLLAEGVRQPCESAHVHPHREILPLDIRRVDVARVGFPTHDFGLASDADSLLSL